MIEGKPNEPRRLLTRERVIAAALALADEKGLEALSMRTLGGRLGVEAMSLYNHVNGKEDLLDALVEAVLSKVERPRIGGDWREEMRRRALSMHAAFRAHGWSPPLVCGRISIGPNMLGLIDATIGCLHAAGFSYPEADHVWNAIDSHIYGFHMLERNMPIAPENYAETAKAYLPSIPEETYPHMRALGMMVAEGAHSGVNDFTFGLDLLLDALETRRLSKG